MVSPRGIALQTSKWIEDLVDQEIERQLIWLQDSGSMASSAECVRKVLDIYPACGLSPAELTDRVIVAAAKLKLPLHIDGGRKKK
jgi:hypothetical protein